MAWHILNERTNKVLKYIDNKGGGNLWIKNLIII
jgi:PadR family transcriptional regulator PadR